MSLQHSSTILHLTNMEPSISIEVRTSYGEDLYIYPYSYNYKSEKLFFYASSAFTVKDTQQYLRKIEEISKTKKTIVKYFNCFKEWLEVFSWQFEDFFGSAVFNENFNRKTWDLQLYWLLASLELSTVFTAESVFGKDISLRGQLHIQEHKYVEKCYLTPTKEYFDDRLEEWINEINNKEFRDRFLDLERKYWSEESAQDTLEYEIEFRQDYKNWRDAETAKGNRIEYLYLLNT